MVSIGSCDASFADLHALASGQHHVRHMDLSDLIEYFARRVPQVSPASTVSRASSTQAPPKSTGSRARGKRRLPYHYDPTLSLLS